MKKRNVPNTKCRICEREFYVKPYLLRQGWGKYCSRKCQNKSQKTGRFVICSYCGKKIYRSLNDLQRESRTGTYFCNKSCQCAWKNRQRRGQQRSKLFKHLRRPWCNSSTTGCGPVREDANSFGLPTFFLRFLGFRRKKIKPSLLKRPSKKILHNLYWKRNYNQTMIAEIFNATHASVKRWFCYYKIPVKPRTLSCGRNPNSIKNLELGKTPEVERKSAEARRIYTKEKLIQMIKAFVEKHGRIPTKNEFVKMRNSFYPNHTTFRDYFGTWNNAIKEAGYEPNERWFTTRDLFAKDGHKCHSISEIIIDDWFFENHIPHIREYLYPEGRYSCDFVVNNIFIEFFGLVNALNISPNYGEIIKKKKEMCKKYNIQLIELYEKDLYNLDYALGKRLDIKSNQEILL